jgi:AI-2 transport protein TqsA
MMVEIRTAIGLIAVIAVLAASYFASSVLQPLAFALFFIAILWPLQSRLQSRMPKPLAVAIVLLLTIVAFSVFASLVAWSFARVGRWLVNDTARYQLLYEQVAAWLESHGIALASLWADHFNVGWLVRVVQEITGRINTTLTFWLVVLVYVILGLLEVDDMDRRIRAMKNQEAARVLLDGTVATAVKFRKYMLVRTLMSLMTGVLVWATAALMGLPLAVEWGVIAFVLNYIPIIGPFIATLLPALFELAQLAPWQAVLVLFGSLIIIQFVVGSYIEPRAAGSMLAISPIVTLFSVFFWTHLWGLTGAFIGVPITIALLAFCAQHPSSRWLAELLGDQRKEPPRDRRTQ